MAILLLALFGAAPKEDGRPRPAVLGDETWIGIVEEVEGTVSPRLLLGAEEAPDPLLARALAVRKCSRASFLAKSRELVRRLEARPARAVAKAAPWVGQVESVELPALVVIPDPDQVSDPVPLRPAEEVAMRLLVRIPATAQEDFR